MRPMPALHLLIIALGGLALYHADLTSADAFEGAFLPVAGFLFIVYLLVLLFRRARGQGGGHSGPDTSFGVHSTGDTYSDSGGWDGGSDGGGGDGGGGD